MTLVLNTELFLYDISALIRAFYPGEGQEIKVSDHVEESGGLVVFIDQREQVRVSIRDKGRTFYDETRDFIGKEKPYWNPQRDGEKELHKTSLRNQERREYKNLVKRLLFFGLRECTGKTPAWGTLTGVRPTKLAMEKILLGQGEDEVTKSLCRDYLCREEKARLATRIARVERDILNGIGWQDGYSLYLGIPFCPTTCHYCSFASYSLERFSSLVPEYLASLRQEIGAVAELMKGKKLSCVYFGGGTPTSLSAKELEELLTYVEEAFPVGEAAELTVEAGRPDSITKEKLLVLKDHQVDRISINPQTMKQETLDRIGRGHTIGEIIECYDLARSLGFDNINMDLILGLPGETEEDVGHTLAQIEKMVPDSLTVHSMVIKRAASLRKEMTAKEGADPESMNRMVEMGGACARRMGLRPYYMYRQKNARGSMDESRDNIGYAKPGKEGRYNIIIMEEVQTIVALGAGGTTKLVDPISGRIDRADNVKSITDYIARTEEMIERKVRLLGG